MLSARERRIFALRKARSLAGILPLGAFLVAHLFLMATAAMGRARFSAAIAWFDALPGLVVLEAVLIWLPLLFHGLSGLWLAAEGESNAARFPRAANWLYFLQRLAGVVTLVFVAWHLYATRIARALLEWDAEALWEAMAEKIGQGPYLALYAAGAAAAVFHLTNGLRTAARSWGLVSGRAGRRRAAIAASLLGLGLVALAAAALAGFAGPGR